MSVRLTGTQSLLAASIPRPETTLTERHSQEIESTFTPVGRLRDCLIQAVARPQAREGIVHHLETGGSAVSLPDEKKKMWEIESQITQRTGHH